jgi:hypothetical protein
MNEEHQCSYHFESGDMKYDYLQQKNCKKPETCNFAIGFSQNFTCENNTYTSKFYDTHSCALPDDCFSANCTEKKCVGFPENTTCVSTDQCKIGYFCNTTDEDVAKRTCTRQLIKDSNCTSTIQCINSLGCHTTCIEFFSLDDGTEVKSNDSRLCKSNKLADGKCVSSKKTQDNCAAKDVNARTCFITIGDQNTTAVCQCGLSDTDKQYCPLATSDTVWQDQISALKSNINKSTKRHSSERNNFEMSSSEAKDDARADNWPKLEGADSCLMNVYLSSNKLAVSIVFTLVLIAFAVLF